MVAAAACWRTLSVVAVLVIIFVRLRSDTLINSGSVP
jgi:hypothetical protein